MPNEGSLQASRFDRLFTPVALLLLVTFAGLGIWFIRTNSQTFDEAVHLAGGYSYLSTGDYRINPEHPPLIKELAALPAKIGYQRPWPPNQAVWDQLTTTPALQWLAGRDFLYGDPSLTVRLLTSGRLVNLCLGLLLVALVGWWSYRIWGKGAALISLTLAAFEPNLIAHSSLVTTDVGVTLFTVLAVYCLWEYLRAPRWSWLIGTGTAAGLSLVSKFSGVVVLGMIAGIIGHEICFGDFRLPRRTEAGRLPIRARLMHGAMAGVVIAVCVAAIIPSAYHFADYSTWWHGFSAIMNTQDEGRIGFFMGEISRRGWWSYFPVAFLIKTPIGSILLIAASLVLMRKGARLTTQQSAVLLFPVLLVLALVSQARIDIGLRHILTVYPFLFILASRLATIPFRSSRWRVAAIGVPLAITVISSLRIAPHQLAYFNEAVGGPAAGARYLSDSNIDWGQDLWNVRKYLARENAGVPYLSFFGTAPASSYGFKFQTLPTAGAMDPTLTDRVNPQATRQLLLISIVNLQGTLFDNHDLYQWLRSRTPIARIGYSVNVYDIGRDDAAHAALAKAYLEAGPAQFAIVEIEQALAINPSNQEAMSLLAQLRAASGGSQ